MNSGLNPAANGHGGGRVAAVLRVFSLSTLVLAVFSAVLVFGLRLIHLFQPGLLQWNLKSAIPLILIGVAFASLQFSLPRTRGQILTGLMAAAAFVLWGTEQFLSNHTLVSGIDDLVVLLFVVDLGLVIYGQLRPGAG